MLSRKEIGNVALLGIVVLALGIGGEYVTSSQRVRLEDLRKRISNSISPNAAAEVAAKKRLLKKRKLEAARWNVLLAGAKKVFPRSSTAAISNEEVAALVAHSGVTLVKIDRGPTTDLTWTPPRSAEEESGSEEGADPTAPHPGLVKYAEDTVHLTLRGDYRSWLKFLVALEQLHKMYRFKELSLKSAHATADHPPLTIDLDLASYRVIEFPADRKPANAGE